MNLVEPKTFSINLNAQHVKGKTHIVKKIRKLVTILFFSNFR